MSEPGGRVPTEAERGQAFMAALEKLKATHGVELVPAVNVKRIGSAVIAEAVIQVNVLPRWVPEDAGG